MFRLIAALSVLYVVSAGIASDDRIVNGRASSIMDFPYQVSIQKYGSHFCGGSILDERHILTAAHCMVGENAEDITVRYGSSNRSSGGSLNYVAQIFNHPEYDPPSNEHDVSVLKLKRQIVMSATAQPVTICKSDPRTGETATVSGWGKLDDKNDNLPSNLQSVDLSMVSTKDCPSYQYGWGQFIKPSMICAVGVSKDSCQGDSGGPLVMKNTYTQVGIVSFGAGCADNKHAGVYSSLTEPSNRNFIIKTAGIRP